MAISTGVVFIGCLLYGLATNSILFPISAAVFWVFLLFTYAYLMSVAGHIYRGALYIFASEGVTPTGFSAQMFEAAWKRKK